MESVLNPYALEFPGLPPNDPDLPVGWEGVECHGLSHGDPMHTHGFPNGNFSIIRQRFYEGFFKFPEVIGPGNPGRFRVL